MILSQHGDKMTESRRLEGVLVVLVTPMCEDETVDEGALRKLVRRVLAAGVHGVVALGSASEFAVLTDEQKGRAIAIVVDEVDGRVPVVIGTGEPGTKRAVAMTQKAKRLGADAALVVPPYYYNPNREAILRYYSTVASEGGLDILLYNIPFFTKVALELDVVQELAETPGIVGIKDSSGNLGYFQRLTSAKSDTFSVVTGSDSLLFAQTVAGGDGCISPGANLVPDWFVHLWEAVGNDRWPEAWALQKQIQALHRGIGLGTFPAGIKGALSLLGIGARWVGAPNVPVTDEQSAAIEAALERFGLL
jgi:4-hydroxy-tetrahydrodipicolinate synthase